MAYQSPSPKASPSIDYSWMVPSGTTPSYQLPPSDLSFLRQPPQQTSALANTMPGMFSLPKQVNGKVQGWIKGYLKEWKEDPIKARKDFDVAVILGAKKIMVVMIRAFEQPSLKTKPNTYGLMEVSDHIDQWTARTFNVDLGSKSAQVGMFVGEFFAPMGIIGKSQHTMKVGQEAIHFLRATQRARPLAQQGFGQQMRMIEQLQQPLYRSGFVSEKTVQQARKAVNMPAWKKMSIDMKHMVSGHMQGGWRTGCKENNKTLFPEGFSEAQVEKIIRQAYRNGKKVKTQGEMVVVRGEYEGIKIEMHVDVKNKIIKTAYPKK